MAKKNEDSKPKRLSLKKDPAGDVASPARRTRERPRARPWPTGYIKEPEVITMTGIITSADGVPIPGIEVTIEGIEKTVSDKCGNFKINFPPDFSATLIFTWADGTAKINIEKLKKIPVIISLKAIPKYVNKVCDKNFKEEANIDLT